MLRNALMRWALLVWSCLPLAYGLDADKLVPARWPGGPLDAVRRASGERTIPPVDLLHGTPINCLLVGWSGPGDAAVVREQQRVAGEFAEQAHQRGMAVLGLVQAGSDAAQAVAAAVEAHLDGLALEPDFADFGRLPEGKIALVPLQAGGGAPGIRVLSDSGAAVATPTSEPWIDSNVWLVRSLRAKGQAPVWLGFALEHPSIDNYVRAIADAAAAGGQWVVAPDDGLLRGLAAKKPEAVAQWHAISEALGFFERHKAWREFAATGVVGIVRDPMTRYPDIADETLNLIARRRIPYRMIDRAGLCAPAIEGLKALVTTEMAEPTESEKLLLKDFAGHGGLVVDKSSDPESLSKNLLHVLGKGNLGLRLFNAPSVLPYVSASEDGKQLLVQMINYASGPTESITVRVRGAYRTARLLGLNGSAAELPVERSEQDAELAIERIETYAALILEK